jgi:hypothetical protein
VISDYPPRLNWGCGPQPAPGWLNADRIAADGVQLVCDIRDGLPIPDASMRGAVAMHALQDLPWTDIPGAVAELRRVLSRAPRCASACPTSTARSRHTVMTQPEKNPTFSPRAMAERRRCPLAARRCASKRRCSCSCACGPRTEQGLAGVPAHVRMQQAGVELCETATRAD